MKQLYLDIKARLEALCPSVLFIHMFNNQFDLIETGEMPSFPMPAVFIEFENDQPANQLGGGLQIWDPLIIRVHIAHNQLDSGDGDLEQDLNVFDLKQEVYAALQKFEPVGAVQFIRTAETQDYNHTNVYHFIQEYTTNYIDQQQLEPVGGVDSGSPIELDLTVTYNPTPYLKTLQGGPMVFVDKTSLAFPETDVDTISMSQTMTVSGENLDNDIVITAPDGFIINLDNSTDNNTPITLIRTGTSVSPTIIYCSFAPLSGIDYSDSIAIESIDAPAKSVAVTGTGVTVPVDPAFKITVKTDNAGTSASNQFTLPVDTGTYNALIDWGDGNTDTIVSAVSPTHTYASPGNYQISITGVFATIKFDGGGDKLKLLSIDNWGTIQWETLQSSFSGCTNMVGTFTDKPDLSQCTSILGTFLFCSSFNSNLNNWNASNVTNCTYFLGFCPAFNGSMNNWNLSNCPSLEGFFYGNHAFNRPVNSWILNPNLTSVTLTFFECFVFNQSVNNWGQYLDNVTNYEDCFGNCFAYNQPMSLWTTNSAINFKRFFADCHAFDQNINHFNTSAVISMFATIYHCHVYNQPMNLWQTGNVTTMRSMFEESYLFDQDLPWDVSKVVIFDFMFFTCLMFNGDLSAWVTSAATSTKGMFAQTGAFNRAINHFIMSNVAVIELMFMDAFPFNQPIDAWDVTSLTNAINFMQGKDNTNYSAENLDGIYNGWSVQPLRPNVQADFGAINYTVAGASGKSVMAAAPNNWIITDGGQI